MKSSIITLILFFGSYLASAQQAPQHIANSLQAILDASLPQGVSNPGAVLTVSVPGQWTWTGASGKAISGITSGQPVTDALPGMHFRAGSITKLFTATAIMQLDEAGLLDINDDVSLYLRPTMLNDTIQSSDVLTIRHLLNHTSGVANSADNQTCLQDALSDLTRFFPLEEAIWCGASQGEYFPPGFAWGYSNTNYSILAYIIQEVSGQSWADYVTNNILTPAGLSQTFIPTVDQLTQPHMGCYWDLGGNLLDMTIVDGSLYAGWADVVSTTDDLVDFLDTLQNGFISPASFNTMQTIDPTSWDYGMGMEFYQIGGNDYYGHSGEVGNTSGLFFMDVQTAALPNGYYVSYNYNYEGVSSLTVLDDPIWQLLSNMQPAGLTDNPSLVSNVFTYPNPANGHFQINNLDKFNQPQVSLHDLTGREVKSWPIGTTTFECDGLAAIPYLVRITHTEGVQITRVMIR